MELELPDRITTISEVGELLVLGLPDSSKYLVDPNAGTKRGIMIAGTATTSIAMLQPLGVYASGRGSLELVDFAVGEHWPLTRDRFWDRAQISADGTMVVAVSTDPTTNPTVWKIDLPSTPSATAAWLDEQTNATAELGSTTLAWH